MEGLHRRLQEEAHDTRRRRVSATVSPACPAERIAFPRIRHYGLCASSQRQRRACDCRPPARTQRRRGLSAIELQPGVRRAAAEWWERFLEADRHRRHGLSVVRGGPHASGSAPSRRSKSPCSPSASPLRGRTPHEPHRLDDSASATTQATPRLAPVCSRRQSRSASVPEIGPFSVRTTDFGSPFRAGDRAHRSTSTTSDRLKSP